MFYGCFLHFFFVFLFFCWCTVKLCFRATILFLQRSPKSRLHATSGFFLDHRIRHIIGCVSIADRRTLVSLWSQAITGSQTIAELFAICDRLRTYKNQPLSSVFSYEIVFFEFHRLKSRTYKQWQCIPAVPCISTNQYSFPNKAKFHTPFVQSVYLPQRSLSFGYKV